MAALCLVACLGLAAAGCGGSGDSTTGGGSTTASPSESASTGGGNNQSGEGNASGKQEGGGAQSGGSSGGGGSTGAHQNYNREPTQKEAEGFKAEPGGDNSIQTYGSEAPESEEEEVVSTMRSFFRALASYDYKALCDGITASNREAFVKFLQAKKEKGTCESVLEKLLVKGSADEARRAANGVVYQVRVEDGNAFILFTPEGGVASYFVMKDENGSWKATGINSGTPMRPGEQPGGAAQ
jgi:hypothetical protein